MTAHEHYDLYLSYSGRHTYLVCPRKYYFMYVLRDRTRGDPRRSFLGSAIGKVYEWFYSNQYWARPDPVAAALASVDDALNWTYQKEHWSPATDPAFCTILRRDLQKFIPEGIEIIRQNGFLTPRSQAEIDLTSVYTSPKDGMTLKLGGRADFLHGQSATDMWLLDGKASKHREKYVDSEQLIWYAVQYYVKYHVAPSKLGFVFWCFPEDPVKWVVYDNRAMRESIAKTFEVAKKIQLKMFDPVVSGECQRCDFIGRCEEGQRHVAKKKVESGSRIESSIFDLELAD